jgi:phospholipid transport system transporter-binding protein
MASIEKQGARLIIRNAMTVETASALLAEASPLLSGSIEVDLSAVSDVDSSSISLMFEWLRLAQKNNANVVYSNLPQTLVSLASLYGVLELIPQRSSH